MGREGVIYFYDNSESHKNNSERSFLTAEILDLSINPMTPCVQKIARTFCEIFNVCFKTWSTLDVIGLKKKRRIS